MRLHRFYSSEPFQTVAVGTTLHFADAKQWRKVFRFKTGDSVILFDGSGVDVVCDVIGYVGDSADVTVREVIPNTVTAKRETYLCAALVKKDTFEWIVQKATELGVSQIFPILAERSEKKNVNQERLEKIIVEASEQSGRGTIPAIHEPIDLESAIDLHREKANQIVWEPTAQLWSGDSFPETTSVIYIGPEGGWSPRELELFKEKGVQLYSMGPQILRAETAVVAGLAPFVFF